MNLTNKVALITGGTQGIGAETALLLAKQGVSLSLVARETKNASILQQVMALGADCKLISSDLSDEKECIRVVEETKKHFGGVDLLVHSAGTAAPGGLLTGAREVWYGAFAIHVHAVFHLAAAAVPSMIERKGGAIVLISSAAGLRGVKNALAYAVAKGTIPQFTRAMAMELADANIRVNCVSPGIIRTRFQDYLTPQQVQNNIENRIPVGREGLPAEVAEVINMLLKNDFVTGENVVIDGGMTMRIV